MNQWVACDWKQVMELGNDRKLVEEQLLRTILGKWTSSPDAIVDIGSPSGEAISVGVAGLLAYVEFGNTDNDPPYYRVVNKDFSGPEHDVVFRYKGERTAMAARNCVPIDEMVHILRYFIANETIPPWVTLEEV